MTNRGHGSTPPASLLDARPCQPSRVSSRFCEKGTQGCDVRHVRIDFGFETPDECECSGYPCAHVPTPRIYLSTPFHGYMRPVTLAMADQLSQAGLWAVADLARKYAVDRPRWWHRLIGRR